jgi:phosphonopyruvate decarboxylase
MVDAAAFLEELEKRGFAFYTGVPDSQLKGFCDQLMLTLGIGDRHIIAPNEGNAVALAAGYHLATGKTAVVYMQNSGLGNAVNPITSLIDPKVYAIPVLFIIGWRGTPGIHDEPQHVKQGEITPELLEILGIDYFVVEKDTSLDGVLETLDTRFLPALREGRSAAIVVKKGGIGPVPSSVPDNGRKLSRERAIQIILGRASATDVVVSTTGKISREVYEYRDAAGQSHERDFLTVGSMGHASMIALQVAERSPGRRVWCLDGDGAMLMHAGSLALIGARRPRNFIHVLLNNFAHESVGGMPTIAGSVDFLGLAKACGYAGSCRVDDETGLVKRLAELNEHKGPFLLEVDVSTGSRPDLGRPKTTPIENKTGFMDFLRSAEDSG